MREALRAALLSVLIFTLMIGVVPMTQLGASGLAGAATEGATAHIGTYLGGESGAKNGALIGGVIGTVTGLVVGSYIGSSMGPAGTILWGWKASSAARTIGSIAGGA
ncbi:MAG: hypothetical protein F4060_00465 [Holophagales bacterium]|nr:hypothetical protein [Holophagales bacterium]MYG31541.1 hypothetical protein [Holophagales bacterium]MYI78389.1 hypothetical protein [Holophagales bacterium]